MGQGRHVARLMAGLMLVLAAPASAGTVTVSGGTLHYTTTSSQRVRLHLDVNAAGAASLYDEDGIVAGPGCTQDPAATVFARCTGVARSVVDAGSTGLSVTVGSVPPVQVNGGAGDDTVENLGLGPVDFSGGVGADRMFAPSSTSFGDVFRGGSGRDEVYYSQRSASQNISLDDVANDGAPGEGDDIRSDVDVVVGGSGDDTLTGGPGRDELDGRGGDDTIAGGAGDDVLDGGSAGSTCGHDELDGGADDDTLFLHGDTHARGGAGDDRLVPDGRWCAAGDFAEGGPGIDTGDFSLEAADGAWVSLDGVADDGATGIDDYEADIENLIAGTGGMALIGNGAPNVLLGGPGDDFLDGGGGADILGGGDGDDVADYSLRVAPVSLTLDGEANDGEAGEQDAIGDDVEDLIGGRGNDFLTGGGGDNVLDGGPGADLMRGGGGFDAVDYSARAVPVSADLDGAAADDGQSGEGDTIDADVEGLFGGLAGDTLTGNALDGFLAGGDGDDRLQDPGGLDAIVGEAGNDSIDSADGAADVVVCGAGTDVTHHDAIDQVATDCESIAAPTPARPAAAPPGSATPVFVKPIDRVAPRAALTLPARLSASSIRVRGLGVAVRCDARCSVAAELRPSSATAAALRRRGIRAGVLARDATATPASGMRRLRLRPSAAGRRALQSLPRGSYLLKVRIRDGAGNLRRLSRVLHLS